MRTILDINDNVSNMKIYQIINECFGKDYHAWMKAWYDINTEYGAWFPTISKEKSRPTGKYGGTKNYINTLSIDGTVIIEEKYDSPPDDDPIDLKYEKKRVVFGRINGKFSFLGIFKKVPHKGEIHCEHKFIRIAECFDLSNFSYLETKNILSKNEIESYENLSSVVGEEKIALTKIRINQGKIRENAMKRYSGRCALCGAKMPKLLIASHIKSWSDSSANEKGDIENVLLLCPNHDALFDKHLITFSDNGSIIISSTIDEFNRTLFNIGEHMHIDVTDGMKKYLNYHRCLLDK